MKQKGLVMKQKELLTVKKKKKKKKKGAASLLTNLFVVHRGVAGVLLRVVC